MLTRITYSNYGIIEHMFSEGSMQDFLDFFWTIFGVLGEPRNSGGIKIVSVGEAVNEQDTGGYIAAASSH